MKKREKEGRARLTWADLVRAAAIVCVVLCHAAEATLQFIYPNIMVQCSALTQLLAYAAMAVGRMGVPLFLFCPAGFCRQGSMIRRARCCSGKGICRALC